MKIISEPNIKNNARKALNKLKPQFLRIIKSAEYDLQKHIEIKSNDVERLYKLLIVLFLRKAIDICRAILSILSTDITLWREATALARTLTEVYTNSRLMKTNPQYWCERFIRFDWVRRYKFMEQISNLSEEMKKTLNADVEKKSELKKEYDKFKNDYGKHQLNTWHGLRSGEFLQIIKEEGEDSYIYQVIYRFQSDQVHAESKILDEYLHQTDEGIEIVKKVTPDDIDRLLVTVITLFTGLYALCNDVLGFNKGELINDFIRKLKKMAKK